MTPSNKAVSGETYIVKLNFVKAQFSGFAGNLDVIIPNKLRVGVAPFFTGKPDPWFACYPVKYCIPAIIGLVQLFVNVIVSAPFQSVVGIVIVATLSVIVTVNSVLPL